MIQTATPEQKAALAETLAYAVPFTQFDTQLSIQYDADASKVLGKDYWRVLDAFKYYVGNKAQNIWVYVPEGYLTDGATVPRPFWSIIPPWGNYGQAAVVHDILCETQQLYFDGKLIPITRKRADQIFLNAMEVAGVSKWKRYLMYTCVRAWAIGRSWFNLKADADKLKRKQALQDAWAT